MLPPNSLLHSSLIQTPFTTLGYQWEVRVPRYPWQQPGGMEEVNVVFAEVPSQGRTWQCQLQGKELPTLPTATKTLSRNSS